MIQGIRCILLCFISTLIFGKSFAQQLDHISPSQNQHYFTQVSFINENEGWAFDEYDHSLYHTINGGKKWEEIFHFTFKVWTLKFTDEKNGYISTDDAEYVYITQDGGQHWHKTHLTNQFNISPGNAHGFVVLDSLHFYFSHYNINDSLFATSDGGVTWSKRILPDQQSYNKTLFAQGLMHLWYVKDNTIFRSVDGGDTWQTLIMFSTRIIENGIYFSDSLNGMVLHYPPGSAPLNIIAVTHDGGLSWSNSDTLKESLTIRHARFHFLNRYNGCLSLNYSHSSNSGLYYGLYVTHNAGLNWSDIKLADPMRADYFISTAGTKKFVRTGLLGLINYSVDSGDNWQTDLKHNPLFQCNAMKFYNEKTGNAVSLNYDGSSEYYVTQDGGAEWIKTGTWYNQDEHGVSSYIIDNDHYLNNYFTGNYNYFRLFRNGGMTNEKILLNGLNLRALHFNDANHIWMATDTAIYFSSDTCHTWHKLSTMPDVISNPASLYFLKDNLHGWLIKSYFAEVIYITNDGGVTWLSVSIAKRNHIYGLYFSDSIHGWLFDNDLYQTSNGGLNWQKQTINFNGPEVLIKQMLFTDAKNGWLIGDYTNDGSCCDHIRQFVACTNDSGQTWKTIFNKKISHNYSDYYSPFLDAIAATDSNHVWIYGQLYEMYKLHYEGESTFPDVCHLEVFPNPSRVSFEIDLTCFGTEPKEVMIYDAVGKLVKQYQLQTETSFYEADAHLRDGIYLIHVKSASKSGTVKFIMSSIKKL